MSLMVRSVYGISRLCACDWEMSFAGNRPAGWVLTRLDPGCQVQSHRRLAIFGGGER